MRIAKQNQHQGHRSHTKRYKQQPRSQASETFPGPPTLLTNKKNNKKKHSNNAVPTPSLFVLEKPLPPVRSA